MARFIASIADLDRKFSGPDVRVQVGYLEKRETSEYLVICINHDNRTLSTILEIDATCLTESTITDAISGEKTAIWDSKKGEFYVNNEDLTGEVDLADGAIDKMPLYKENEAKGGYKAYLASQNVVPTDVYLNLTYKDDNWRKVVQDERFRKALNLGINRKEIIDAIYLGFAEPSTIQDPTYDLTVANKLLDEMGMTKGADGFRKGPNGKKFTVPFEVQSAYTPDMIPVTQLMLPILVWSSFSSRNDNC